LRVHITTKAAHRAVEGTGFGRDGREAGADKLAETQIGGARLLQDEFGRQIERGSPLRVLPCNRAEFLASP
jgi:hypothetical protein